MGLFVIGVLLGLMMFYVLGLSVYIADMKQRVDKVIKAITECETCAKDQKSIANDTVKGNDDECTN